MECVSGLYYPEYQTVLFQIDLLYVCQMDVCANTTGHSTERHAEVVMARALC